MIKCEECELYYDVIWNNDGGEPPLSFCPRCGAEDPTNEDNQEELSDEE